MPTGKTSATEMTKLADVVQGRKKADADAKERADQKRWNRSVAARQRREAKLRRKAARDPLAKALFAKLMALIEKKAKDGNKEIHPKVYGEVLETPADFYKWRSMDREDFLRKQEPNKYIVDAVAKRLRKEGYDVCFTRHWSGSICMNPYNDGTGHSSQMEDASEDVGVQSLFDSYRTPDGEGRMEGESQTRVLVRWGKSKDD